MKTMDRLEKAELGVFQNPRSCSKNISELLLHMLVHSQSIILIFKMKTTPGAWVFADAREDKNKQRRRASLRKF